VYWAQTGHLPASVASLLTPGERTRASEYRHHSDARSFVAGRALLRLAIGHRLGRPAQAVHVATPTGEPFGKVELPGTGLKVSLTRDHRVVGLAVTPRVPIGLDVLHPPDELALRDIDLVLSAREKAALGMLSPSARRAALCRLWVTKEAIVKATGAGINSSICLINASTERPSVDHESGPRDLGLLTHQLTPSVDPSAFAAVAIAAPPGTSCLVRQEQWLLGDVEAAVDPALGRPPREIAAIHDAT
jgi:4'-phosphopantetheinyl transferase